MEYLIEVVVGWHLGMINKDTPVSVKFLDKNMEPVVRFKTK